VQLIEMPTDDEIMDNIIAYWVPEKQPQPGDRIDFRYRLHWLADEPFPTPLGRCVATRLSRGGEPGQPRPSGVRKFLVEFLGGPLAELPNGVKPDLILWASRGKFSNLRPEAVPDDVPGHWRVHFDLTVDGHEPVEMRLYLRSGDKVLTETWLYQYHPFLTDSRRSVIETRPRQGARRLSCRQAKKGREEHHARRARSLHRYPGILGFGPLPLI